MSTTTGRGAIFGFFVTATAATLALAAACRTALAQLERSDPGSVLLALCAVAGCAAAGWLCALSGLHLAATLPGRLGRLVARLADRVTPAVLRQGLALVVTTSSVAVVLPGASVSASAATTGTPGHGGEDPAGPPSVSAPDPGWRATVPTSVPDASWRATAVPHERSAARPAVAPSAGWTPHRPRPVQQPSLEVIGGRAAPADEPGVSHVVRRGDCLWDVVERHLGSRATPAEVVAALPHWYETNRSVIGDDPDLVLPGIVLHAPDPLPAAGRTAR